MCAVSAGGFGRNIDHPISSTIYALELTTVTPLLPFTVSVIAVGVVVLTLAVLFLVHGIRRKRAKIPPRA
jgi:hypothetical protein